MADANYGVAREKCEAREGRRQDRCVDEAKAAREAANRQARVEKVDSTGGVFGRRRGGQAGARPAVLTVQVLGSRPSPRR